jgi:hypothetical protein
MRRLTRHAVHRIAAKDRNNIHISLTGVKHELCLNNKKEGILKKRNYGAG